MHADFQPQRSGFVARWRSYCCQPKLHLSECRSRQIGKTNEQKTCMMIQSIGSFQYRTLAFFSRYLLISPESEIWEATTPNDPPLLCLGSGGERLYVATHPRNPSRQILPALRHLLLLALRHFQSRMTGRSTLSSQYQTPAKQADGASTWSFPGPDPWRLGFLNMLTRLVGRNCRYKPLAQLPRHFHLGSLSCHPNARRRR